mmetsp:Transcript_8480/g.20362  ORF Transcript_8480/g.20362 Transcript_8480/m.20362 type:complete len:217 (+) Transcript_8480:435-1085(+)
MSGASIAAPRCSSSSTLAVAPTLAARWRRESSIAPLSVTVSGTGMPRPSATSSASLIRRTDPMCACHSLTSPPLRMSLKVPCRSPLATASQRVSRSSSGRTAQGAVNLRSMYLATANFSFSARPSPADGLQVARRPPASANVSRLIMAESATSSSPSLSALQSHVSSWSLVRRGAFSSRTEFTNWFPSCWNIWTTEGSHTLTSRVKLRTLLMCTPI